MNEQGVLIESYRLLVGDLVTALAGRARAGHRVEDVREWLVAAGGPLSDGGSHEAIADFVRGLGAPCRLMRLVRAADAKDAVAEVGVGA